MDKESSGYTNARTQTGNAALWPRLPQAPGAATEPLSGPPPATAHHRHLRRPLPRQGASMPSFHKTPRRCTTLPRPRAPAPKRAARHCGHAFRKLQAQPQSRYLARHPPQPTPPALAPGTAAPGARQCPANPTPSLAHHPPRPCPLRCRHRSHNRWPPPPRAYDRNRPHAMPRDTPPRRARPSPPPVFMRFKVREIWAVDLTR